MTEAVDPAPMSRTKATLYAIGLPLAMVALVLWPAGRIGWMAGWLFLLVLTVAMALSAVVLTRANPVIFRARSRFQPGTERWDLMLLAVMLPAMIAEIPVAAWDAGRAGRVVAPLGVMIFGYVLLLGGIALMTWAQAVNAFFEPGVRLQRERHQRVITSGPYAIVRHPGYSAAIAIFTGMPLALGSWWGLLPAGIAIAVLVLRTSWEDRLLQGQLPGYADYAHRRRFRLVPGLW